MTMVALGNDRKMQKGGVAEEFWSYIIPIFLFTVKISLCCSIKWYNIPSINKGSCWNMKMKHKMRGFLALLLGVCLLGGCGSGTGTETARESAATKVSEETENVREMDESVSADGEMKIHFLDVGQGLAILVQAEGQTLIYDGGDRDTSSFVVSYLKEQGIERIDYLISSHYDADHLAGLIGCLGAFPVDTVIASDYVHDSQLYTSFVNALTEKNLEIEHPAVGTVYPLGSGSFQILAPQTVRANESNDNSVAIKVTNGANRFIFTGDAEYSSEEAMCQSGIDLECDVLVPGHHGSATATSWTFLQETVPEYAVISCGAGNQYGHPHMDTMEKLESMEIAVYRTDKQGTITVISDGMDLIWSVDACNDYSPGDPDDTGTRPASERAETSANASVASVSGTEDQVWISATGSKYHRNNTCSGMNPDKAVQMSRADAEAKGLKPCKRCY